MQIRQLLTACMFMLATAPATLAQNAPADWSKIYRATPEKTFNLIHTRLEVVFDYAKRQMPGKAWLTLSPHFYASDSLILDAKGMTIREVALMGGTTRRALTYDYADSMHLRIKLPKAYRRGERLTVYIDYISRPDELKLPGSRAISQAKGLYFINPDGKDSTKPIQIWTQGETEGTSVWCPTIDKPNQKTTQEIAMRVPDKYVTLSNGVLARQVKNADGTRTDTWRMDLPHAPYLMFMGVGDYAIVRDRYKQLPVDYYVEKDQAPLARRVFGDTPAMLAFFEKLLGVPYPWPKYAQIVGRDYVSGAMENTTATLHGSMAYQNARQLADENAWEIVVAHELFHHWFGDLVTTESWSNLTVNESFADYSEYLWLEHKYGREAADEYHLNSMQAYLNSPNEHGKHLVRFHYRDKEDMFDLVSYQKGGRILHMLRNQLGDSAFFKGLQLFLQQNRFKAAEAHQVRLALEEVSGRDLNPFFNQWYFNSGHPQVNISYGQSTDGRDRVVIEQKQKDRVFELPLTIVSYDSRGGDVRRHSVVAKNASDTFYFTAANGPRFYEADADRVMLWDKKEDKSTEAWIAQFRRGANYISTREAMDAMAEKQPMNSDTRDAMLAALRHKYHGIRVRALRYFEKHPQQLQTEADWKLIETIAKTDKHRPTRAEAIDVLAAGKPKAYQPLFESALRDSSYSVAGAALDALLETDPAKALQVAPSLQDDALGRLEHAVEVVNYVSRSPEEADGVLAEYKELSIFERLMQIRGLTLYAAKIPTADPFIRLLTPALESFRRIPGDFGGFRSQSKAHFEKLLKKVVALAAGNPPDAERQKQADWLRAELEK